MVDRGRGVGDIRRMTRLTAISVIGVTLLAAGSAFPSQPDEIVPRHEPVTISRDATIRPGTYRIADPEDHGAVRIIGDGVTIDFQGAELVGSPDGAAPDTYTGRGIVIRGRNVTVKNAGVRGFKVGIYAEESPGLTINGCDVSRNYCQRLRSTAEREDLSDWLFGHENDDNQWLRYGAGLYLYRCPRATLSGNRGRNGQNGICVSRCDDSVIIDNDMSFMSGWGIAMWRTSRCDVSHNKTDWCMRGYSHGIYQRGQDSAGILVYEQCSDNVFAYNSATHSGDGFFLYAGNETLRKTGEGGCNRNLVFRNDFSHAAANGIECTFSEGNVFAENVLNECEHGIWAGYSYDTVIVGNEIADCNHGISIEHGRDNLIAENSFRNTPLGVHLWWDNDKDLLASDFGRAHANCPSTASVVIGNRFEGANVAIRLADDTGSRFVCNRMEQVNTALHVTGQAEGMLFCHNAVGRSTIRQEAQGKYVAESNTNACGCTTGRWFTRITSLLFPETRGTQDTALPDNHPRGRRYIFVDEWGPYDFTDVRLFPKNVTGGDRATMQVLGPSGEFKVTNVNGDVTVVPLQGELPGTMTVAAKEEGFQKFDLTVEAGGKKLTATGTLMRTDWTVRFFKWDASTDPRKNPAAWDALIRRPPLEERRVRSIDLIWGSRAPGGTVPRDRFGTLATTTVRLGAGTWLVRTVSDDGIRVWIDGRRVIDDWTWHPPREHVATVELADGAHAIRIEHFEIDGHAQLQFHLERR